MSSALFNFGNENRAKGILPKSAAYGSCSAVVARVLFAGRGRVQPLSIARITWQQHPSVSPNMNLHAIILAVRAFIKSADVMPNGPKFLLLVLLVVAASSCYIIGKALDKAPDILHEMPPNIRAMREQPQLENHAGGAKGQAN